MRKFFLCAIAIMILGATGVAAGEMDTDVLSWCAEDVEVPIIMYHLVTEKPKYIGKFGISPAQLEADLKYLSDNNYATVIVQDLINFVESGAPLPQKPVMLTFDDGNFSDYEILLPLLKKYDKRAVIAVLGETADRFTAEAEKYPAGRFPHLTWSQIQELHESGYAEIQSHSYNLHTAPLGSREKQGESPEVYHARLLADLKKFQQACNLHLRYTPTAFVYPLGAIGKDSRNVLEELGMVSSISCQEGKNIIRQGDHDCLFRLHRTNRPSNRSIEDILRSISS